MKVCYNGICWMKISLKKSGLWIEHFDIYGFMNYQVKFPV